MQYFTFDAAQTQLEAHVESINPATQRHMKMKAAYLKTLYDEQKLTNQLVIDCELVGNVVNEADLTAEDVADANAVTVVKAIINTKTCAFDVAAITSDATTGDRIVTYKLKSCDKASYIPSTHELFEPLSYLLLFPCGERGWGSDIAKSFPFSKYLCARMLAGEQGARLDLTVKNPLRVWNKARTRQLCVNRFQLMSRLGQLYLVDMTSRAIDFRLHWQKTHETYMFGGIPRPVAEEEGQEENATTAWEPGVTINCRINDPKIHELR